MAEVQPTFHGSREAAMVFLFLAGAQRFRMSAHPGFSAGSPFLHEEVRDAIREPKRRELCGSALLPVWKPVTRAIDIAERIEEARTPEFDSHASGE